MKITTDMVKELRQATGAGVLEAKKALEDSGGNHDRAVDALREKGMARAARKADRQASEGLIEVYSHPGGRVGVMVELNCETDFVARNQLFRTLAHDLALQVAAMAPRYLRPEEVPQQEIDRELDVLRAQALAEGKPQAVVEKIVSGRLARFYEELCLLEQPFVKDEKVRVKVLVTNAVAALGENVVVRRFARYELGEAL